MGLLRFRYRDGPLRIGYLVDGIVFDLSENFESYSAAVCELNSLTERFVTKESLQTFSVKEIQIKSPVEPSSIIRLEGCYEHDVIDKGANPHVEDAGLNEMSNPGLWVAPTTTLTSDQSTVHIPPQITDVRPSVELGVVVGKKASQVKGEAARESVAGVTVCAGVTAYDELPGLMATRCSITFCMRPCSRSSQATQYRRFDAWSQTQR